MKPDIVHFASHQLTCVEASSIQTFSLLAPFPRSFNVPLGPKITSINGSLRPPDRCRQLIIQ